MINMKIKQKKLELNMVGSDDSIIDELTFAVRRILKALEDTGGKSVQENLTVLLLLLCAENEESNSY